MNALACDLFLKLFLSVFFLNLQYIRWKKDRQGRQAPGGMHPIRPFAMSMRSMRPMRYQAGCLWREGETQAVAVHPSLCAMGQRPT